MKLEKILKELDEVKEAIHYAIPCMLLDGNSEERDDLIKAEIKIEAILHYLPSFVNQIREKQ
jgi:hypothetical protein